MTRRVLAESRGYVLTSEYETVFVDCRATGRRTLAGYHVADPACGVIAPDESWFATGGEGVAVFTFAAGERRYLREPVRHVAAMKLDDDATLRILIDPWSADASVWKLDPLTGDLAKLRDGPDLRDAPYRDDVDY